MEELEHSEFINDKLLDQLAKIYTVSFIDELDEVETNLSIWYNGDTEFLCFSLKIGDIWISNMLETLSFVGKLDIETICDNIKEKVVNRQKNDLTYKEYISLNDIQGDFD